MSNLTSLDVFSCIGCHAIGFHRAGIETNAFCEVNEFRRRELVQRFPDRQIYGDIREPGIYESGKVDVIIGGPPCQRTSKAAAIHGRRTGETLWPDMLSVGLAVGAEWFVVEQPLETQRGKQKPVAIYPALVLKYQESNLALAMLVHRIYDGAYSYLPAPACRDWRSPGGRSHPRLRQSRGQQMPEVIGTRVSSHLYRWMLGLPESVAAQDGK